VSRDDIRWRMADRIGEALVVVLAIGVILWFAFFGGAK
jgi:hypothetical protein